MQKFILEDFKATSTDASVTLDSGSVSLKSISKTFSQKFYGEQKVFTYELEKEFAAEEYIVLYYEAQGLRRQYAVKMPLVYGITEKGEEPFVCFDDVILDNRKHIVCAKIKPGTYKGIKVAYSIDRRRFAHFTISEMYTCIESELPVACHKGQGEEKRNFCTIDLKDYYNGKFDCTKHDSIVDGGRFFEDTDIYLYGIPFKVAPEGNNLVVPAPGPKENGDIIDNFGVPVKRKFCRPISRDSIIEIPINKKTTEVYFILSLDGKRYQRWCFAQDGTVLGAIVGEANMPLLVEDTTGFVVEVLYKNGDRDTHLPLNLSLGRHGVSGDISVYGIPTSGEEIEKVVFHNCLLDTDICLAAITLNDTDIRMHPEMLIPETEEKIVHDVATAKEITLNGTIFIVKNGAISMEIDLSSGMKLLNMKNDFIKSFSVGESDMLKLRTGNDYDSVFEFLGARVNRYEANLSFKKGELYIGVDVSLGELNDIKWQLKAKNNGKNSVKYGIVFPCISGINHENSEDNWYFMPKYQNILSNETVFIYEESSPNFPMQFMDVFSPKCQGGLALTTQERDIITRKYALEKNEEGIEIYVEYPEMYGEIKEKEEFTGSPSVLTAHAGDWRTSFEIYKNWLDTWYEPYQCQDKDWYRKCFWLLTEYSDFILEDKPINKLPIWNDPKTKELYFEKILEEQKKVAGCYPDILHLWSSWCHRMENDKIDIKWGNWAGEDYDNYGGVEKLRDALHKIQDEKGVNISLYFHPTLLSECYGHLSHFLDKYKVINDIGDNVMCGPTTYRMCHANDDWREHAISVFTRAYKELGIPIMYVDEFSLRCENRCYADGHGHNIPSNLLKTDRDFIVSLKNEMPAEVVLYGEYAAVDIYAGYIDCNISYYVTENLCDMIEYSWKGGDGDDRLGRLYLNIYRFAFPKIVQLILPSGMRNLSWHPQKFIFFNGEAVYDSFWYCEESVGDNFNIKAFKIKKKYADCFTSDNPSCMVDTLSSAICANCFPAADRTLYTIYNRAYSTYRGQALRVEHTEGAKYYDVWNDKPLEVEIKDGYAEISLTVDAQEMGCILISK